MSSTVVVASRHDTRRFTCASCTWEFLRDLGQTFGWHPRGTTYVTTARQRTPPLASIRHDYQPGGEQDYKQIAAPDAMEWARALDVAKQSGHFDGMIDAHAGLICSPRKALLNTLDEFIDFASAGAFVFAFSEDSDDRLDSRQAMTEIEHPAAVG
jgi:hypothetical protein